jgi:hypothetical protein
MMRDSDPSSPEIASGDDLKSTNGSTNSTSDSLDVKIVDTTTTLADPSVTDFEKLASLTIEFKRMAAMVEEITSFRFRSEEEEEALDLENLSTDLDDFEEDRVEVADKNNPLEYVRTLEAYNNWAAKQITDNHRELKELRKANAEYRLRLAKHG